MAEFQNLEIKLQAVDNASQVLQKVVDQLEQIKKLTSGSNTITPTGGNSSEIKKQSQALESVAKSYDNIKLAAEGATNTEIRYTNAQNNSTQAAKNYIAATEKKRNALERLSKAQKQLKSAQYDYDLIYGSLQYSNDPKDIERSQQLSDIMWDENPHYVNQQLSKAQRELANAQKAVTSASLQEEKALKALYNSQNNLQAASNNLNKEQKKLEESTQKTAKSFAKLATKAAAIVIIVKRLAKGLYSAVEESGAFVENLNLFAVTFGENYQETLDWALEFADNLGVASNEIVRFTGLFKQLADSIGITEDIATDMSQVLTQLGYDLASFYNISVESAMEKLQAGIFSGQTKPLRSLGLDVTQQTLDNLLKTNEAFKNLGVTSSKALLQSDKAMLRLIVVLQNAQNSFGDINRTINTLSNQIRVFQGALSNLKLAIGDLFAEPFKNALIYINAFLIAITKIIRAFKPIDKESETAGAGMQQFADDIEDANDAATGGGNLDFDEFRVLSSGEDSQLSITQAITEELQKQIQAYNDQISAMNEVGNKAVEIAEKIRDWFIITDDEGAFVDWTDNAKDLLNVLKLISSIVLIIKSGMTFGLPGAITAAVVSILGIAASQDENTREILKDLIESIGRIMQSLYPLLVRIANFVSLLVDLLTPLINLVLDRIVTLLDALSVTLDLMLDPLKFIQSFLNGDYSELIKKDRYLKAGEPPAIERMFSSIGNFFKNLFGGGLHFGDGIGLADGGITDANFIMTHENGVREWVGRQGNSTAVVNDTQMSDVMGTAVRNGVLEALSYNTGTNETFNITVQANLDGQKVYETTRKIARKNGEKFAKV